VIRDTASLVAALQACRSRLTMAMSSVMCVLLSRPQERKIMTSRKWRNLEYRERHQSSTITPHISKPQISSRFITSVTRRKSPATLISTSRLSTPLPLPAPLDLLQQRTHPRAQPRLSRTPTTTGISSSAYDSRSSSRLLLLRLCLLLLLFL
jgi:hypothetical protein